MQGINFSLTWFVKLSIGLSALTFMQIQEYVLEQNVTLTSLSFRFTSLNVLFLSGCLKSQKLERFLTLFSIFLSVPAGEYWHYPKHSDSVEVCHPCPCWTSNQLRTFTLDKVHHPLFARWQNSHIGTEMCACIYPPVCDCVWVLLG